jgi:endoglucanase
MALLHRQFVEPWRAADTGPVFVGEWGAYNKTPHEITLRWMEDCLRVWQEQGWGWALWNFRGPFGVLDSGRSDVDYTPFDSHDLDAKMLELLRRY